MNTTITKLPAHKLPVLVDDVKHQKTKNHKKEKVQKKVHKENSSKRFSR
ncbi:hypothetical protein [Thermocrinis minervae]|uniref:Uncharacterized protein n=1 Tax=Thermocrinis minervae TaxID=381751 RepID=A0A1M6R566_9AQUI|nr:hypothetical protein [Thermocrinis minervae]SHK27594.1 hypothetical protein SAMN05444391_0517 [Thermocrinis minervae]